MTLIKSIAGVRGTIGGLAGETLSPLDITKFAAGYGMWLRERTHNPIVVIGRDARPSGKTISQLVINTLIAQGISVVDLGLSTTPTVEMAVMMEGAQGGIVITASHNPAGWNALKLLNERGEFISAADGRAVLDWSESPKLAFAESKKFGIYKKDESYITKHVEAVLAHELVDLEAVRLKNFKVVVDAVNSTGGIAVPLLLEKLGVETKEIHCEPTGIFPHNPEPLPENITQICHEVASADFDLGIVVDPDVDRLALVSEDGEPFGEEYTLVAVSDYVLSRKKGNTVSNLSSTRALRDITEERGGKYFASAVGEVNVVEKMKEVNAVIGGEGNGGVIVPDLHYGRDALAGIALFLSHAARFGKSVSMLRSTYPNYHISKNKIELTPDIDADRLLASLKEKYKSRPIDTTDGVRIAFDAEWVQLRKSNTEPVIRIFAESESATTADHLANKIMMDLNEFIFV